MKNCYSKKERENRSISLQVQESHSSSLNYHSFSLFKTFYSNNKYRVFYLYLWRDNSTHKCRLYGTHNPFKKCSVRYPCYKRSLWLCEKSHIPWQFLYFAWSCNFSKHILPMVYYIVYTAFQHSIFFHHTLRRRIS